MILRPMTVTWSQVMSSEQIPLGISSQMAVHLENHRNYSPIRCCPTVHPCSLDKVDLQIHRMDACPTFTPAWTTNSGCTSLSQMAGQILENCECSWPAIQSQTPWPSSGQHPMDTAMFSQNTSTSNAVAYGHGQGS